MTDERPRPTAGLRRLVDRLRQGPWRVVIAEASMRPAIEPGDWLLVDPTPGQWPRRGSVVVVREPDSGILAVKRVGARPGDRVPFADGYIVLTEDEAWLTSDATDAEAEAAGFGRPIDSRAYGPVPLEALEGRAWLRYAPIRRFGPLGRVGRRLAQGASRVDIG
jgi:signal peptidase I